MASPITFTATRGLSLLGTEAGAWLASTTSTPDTFDPSNVAHASKLYSTLTASDAAVSDQFGISVALNGAGTLMAVGAHLEDTAGANAGKVYLYTIAGSVVTELTTVTASDAAATDQFGISVALNGAGTLMAVGAYAEDTAGTDAGKVYLYTIAGSVVTELTTVTASDAAATDYFGRSVALNDAGTLMAVGASVEDTAGAYAGKVYLDFSGLATIAVASSGYRSLDVTANSIPAYVIGSPTLTPVATGGDLRWWSGFASGIYIEIPHSTEFDPGTGDFMFLQWVKMSANSAQEFFFRYGYWTGSAYSGGGTISLRAETNGTLAFHVSDDNLATYDTVTSTITVDDDVIRCIAVGREGANYVMYIDDALHASTPVSAAAASLTNTLASLRYGFTQSGIGPLTHGYLALCRVTIGTVTAAMVKAIYKKEKHLFDKYAYYTQVGESYSFDLPTAQINPSTTDTAYMSKSADTTRREQLFWGSEKFYDITTAAVSRVETNYTGIRLAYIQEFLYSTRNNETFTIDLYDEDEDITVSRDSQGYTETRVGQMYDMTVSFRIVER